MGGGWAPWFQSEWSGKIFGSGFRCLVIFLLEMVWSAFWISLYREYSGIVDKRRNM